MTAPLTITFPSLSSWQCQIGGLVLGPGTPYNLERIEGLGAPDVRSGDVARPRDTGEMVGYDFMGGRSIVLVGDFTAWPSSSLSFWQVHQSLANQFLPGQGNVEVPFFVNIPGLGTVCSMVRVRKRNIIVDFNYAAGLGAFIIELHATDPRLYSAAVTGSASLTANGYTQLLFPQSASGNVETRPQLQLAVSTPSGLPSGTLTAGFGNQYGTGAPLSALYVSSQSFAPSPTTPDALVLDADARTVLRNGANARSQLAWSPISVGGATFSAGWSGLYPFGVAALGTGYAGVYSGINFGYTVFTRNWTGLAGCTATFTATFCPAWII